MTNKELAQAVRKGLEYPNFHEVRCDYLVDYGERIEGCALGAAILGLENPEEKLKLWMDIYNNDENDENEFLDLKIAKFLDISLELEHKITQAHCLHKISTLEIAEMLENGEL